MPSITDVRKQYPQYNDMSDRQLADALHAKFYSDIPKADFDAKIGLAPVKVAPAKRTFGDGVKQLGQELASSAPAAGRKLASDVKAGVDDIRTRKPAKSLGEAIGREVDGWKQFGTMIGDAVNVPLAPVNALVRGALSRPYGEGVSALTGGRYSQAQGEKDMDTALMAAMPGKSAPAAVSALAKAPKVSPMAEKVAAFEKAGVRPTLAATMPGGGALAKVAAETPLVGARTRGALQASINDTEKAAQTVAGKYGQPAPRGATGEAVQAGVQGFNERFSARANKLYDQAFNEIEQGQSAAVSSAKSAADLRNARMANFQAKPAPVIEPEQTRATLGALGGRVNASPLSKIITDPRVSSIAGALESGKGELRFGDLRALRTWVREAQRNPELRQGIDQAGLQRMEGALSADITSNAERLAGPQAARRLKQADNFYRLGSQRIEGALQTFVGKGAGAPKAGEATYDLILRAASDRGGADTARLGALKKSLQPREWGEIAATTIDRMGAPTAGAAEDATFSVNRFTTNYAGLSDQGRDLLFGKGALRQELDNLNRVAGMQKGVEKAANTSNTATATRAGVMGAAALNPGLWVPAGQAMAGLALTGEAMTNPAVVRWLTRSARAAQQGPKQLTAVQKQLQIAAKTNAALLPLSQQVTLLLEAPTVARSAAGTEQQPQD